MSSCHLFLISSASVRSIPFLSFIVPISAWNGVLYTGTETLRMQLCRDTSQWFPDFYEQFKSLCGNNFYICNICRIKVAKARRWVTSGQWTDNEAHISSNCKHQESFYLTPNSKCIHQWWRCWILLLELLILFSFFQIQISLIRIIFKQKFVKSGKLSNWKKILIISGRKIWQYVPQEGKV